MSLSVIAQYVMNGAMLGMMYALVAVGFTLFFGVLDIIQFSHGDVVAAGAFSGLAAWTLLTAAGMTSPGLLLIAVIATAAIVTALLGAVVARFIVLPVKTAPQLKVLLVTLLGGTVARGAVPAAVAGVVDGLDYDEVFVGRGLLAGVSGWAAAFLGGLGTVYGAVVGGFLFAALQTVGAVAVPFASAYKDVLAFGVVIL